MFNEALKKKIKEGIPDIVFDEPLGRHLSMGVGGNSDGFVYASYENIGEIIRYCENVGLSYAVIGNGTNILARDTGYKGIVICIGKLMSDAEYCQKCEISVYAGAKLSAIAALAAKNNVAGFEFLAGIPGNLGGALVMNAGAFGGEISQLVASVTYIENGDIKSVSPKNLGFGYRQSYFIKNPKAVILAARLKGRTGYGDDIRAVMVDYSARRENAQPLEYPSSGSFFKRPEGHFAGKLIEDAGLKGKSYGGAAVSDKHAGFIVNTGGATCDDVLKLADIVIKRVFDTSGVLLQPEVRILGE